jgi:hypothetical protein
MRVKLAFLVLLFALAAWPTASHAQKAKANQAAKVLNRPGEQGKTVVKVKEGQVLTVVNKEGRWLKVRVSGRTGYLPRTKVDLPEGDDDVARNTRRRPFVDGRGTKRGFGGEAGPEDRVGADAVEKDEKPDKPEKAEKPDPDENEPKKGGKKPNKTTKEDPEADPDEDVVKVNDGPGDEEQAEERPTARVKKKTSVYSEADPESEEAFAAKPDTKLFLTGKKKGKFTEVEDDEGTLGYVLTSKIEIDEVGGSSGPMTRQLDARARVGVTFIQQGLRSVNGVPMQPDNYNLTTSAATIAVGGQYLRPYNKDVMFGAELAIDIAKAVPGVSAPMGQTTGITFYNVNARGLVGYDLKKKSGMMVFGRLGFRYTSFQISNVEDITKNTAKIPSEIVKAPTFGAALAIPRLTSSVGLRFSVDAMFVGTSLEQTKNLEDGASPSAKGACLGAGFTYRWKPKMDFQATYDLNYAKYSFGAPVANSQRGHMGTSVSRTDIFHGITAGIAYAF